MSKATNEDGKACESAAPAPPRWLSKAEKADFRRVIEARKSVGRPVLATERDTLADYCTCRSRVAALRKMAKSAISEGTKRDPRYGTGPTPGDQRHAAGLIRQIDATTSMARRLAKDLKLLEPEGST